MTDNGSPTYDRIVGFTGTRKGMTMPQISSLPDLFKGILSLHHGECVGADVQAHEIAVKMGRLTVGHPPINPKYRAKCKDIFAEREPKNYLDRNHDIVNETQVLIACPDDIYERKRSGTWATVRYARRQNMPIVIIYPDGNMKLENFPKESV
jgi:hypothetical protein